MPNMHELIDSAAQLITKHTPGKIRFTSLDLKCAFSQLLVVIISSAFCVKKRNARTDSNPTSMA